MDRDVNGRNHSLIYHYTDSWHILVPLYNSLISIFTTMDLILAHQDVYRVLPSSINFYHEKPTIPEIILARIYTSREISSPDLYLLSLQINVTLIEGQVSIDYNQSLSVGAHINE